MIKSISFWGADCPLASVAASQDTARQREVSLEEVPFSCGSEGGPGGQVTFHTTDYSLGLGRAGTVVMVLSSVTDGGEGVRASNGGKSTGRTSGRISASQTLRDPGLSHWVGLESPHRPRNWPSQYRSDISRCGNAYTQLRNSVLNNGTWSVFIEHLP